MAELETQSTESSELPAGADAGAEAEASTDQYETFDDLLEADSGAAVQEALGDVEALLGIEGSDDGDWSEFEVGAAESPDGAEVASADLTDDEIDQLLDEVDAGESYAEPHPVNDQVMQMLHKVREAQAVIDARVQGQQEVDQVLAAELQRERIAAETPDPQQDPLRWHAAQFEAIQQRIDAMEQASQARLHAQEKAQQDAALQGAVAASFEAAEESWPEFREVVEYYHTATANHLQRTGADPGGASALVGRLVTNALSQNVDPAWALYDAAVGMGYQAPDGDEYEEEEEDGLELAEEDYLEPEPAPEYAQRQERIERTQSRAEPRGSKKQALKTTPQKLLDAPDEFWLEAVQDSDKLESVFAHFGVTNG